MDTAARAALRAAADAAGREVWTYRNENLYRGDVSGAIDAYDATGAHTEWPYPPNATSEDISVFAGDVWREVDGEYVAAACPAAIADLLDTLDRVLAYCDERDGYSKGEGPTTARIRAEIEGTAR